MSCIGPYSLPGIHNIDNWSPNQVTCFLMCLFAVSVVSIPSSIIASGFTDEALKKRARAGISSTQNETKAEPPMYESNS